jgi:hypothetical protein
MLGHPRSERARPIVVASWLPLELRLRAVQRSVGDGMGHGVRQGMK